MNEQGSRAEKPPAVILFSGGLDSTTTAGIALQQGFLLHALTFHYGQRHAREVDAASALVRELGIGSHRVAQLDLANRGGSALTDPGRGMPRGRSEEEIATGGIPETYVPARNTIFLSHALAWCEVLGAEDVFIGVNVLDYSGYPDCRPEYLRAFEQLARLATRAGTEARSLQRWRKRSRRKSIRPPARADEAWYRARSRRPTRS